MKKFRISKFRQTKRSHKYYWILIAFLLFSLGIINANQNQILKSCELNSFSNDQINIKSNGGLLALEWCVTWGGQGTERGFGIAISESGHIYLAGDLNNFGASYIDGFIAKFDLEGHLEWNRTIRGSGWDSTGAIAIDNSENIYLAGFTNSFGNGGRDGFILKYVPNGTQLWNRTWGGPNEDAAYGITVDGSGYIYIVGITSSFGQGGNDAFIVKYAPDGTQLWNQTWGGSNDDVFISITNDGAGNIYATGRTVSFGGTGILQALIVNYDSNGNQIWNKTWGQNYYIWIESFAVDSVKNIYITGAANLSGGVADDGFLAKFDSNGNYIWNRTLNIWRGSDIAWSSDNYLFITGSVFSSGSIYLGKFDISGNQIWGINSGIDYYSYGIAINSSNFAYITGDGYDGNALLIKYGLDTSPPSYSTLKESADPLELSRTEIITISGVTDASGIQTVLIEFEGNNHTMSNLGGDTWRYSLWTPSSNGTYPYTIYLQDNAENWNATSGTIEVVVSGGGIPAFTLSLLLMVTAGIAGFFLRKRRMGEKS